MQSIYGVMTPGESNIYGKLKSKQYDSSGVEPVRHWPYVTSKKGGLLFYQFAYSNNAITPFYSYIINTGSKA